MDWLWPGDGWVGPGPSGSPRDPQSCNEGAAVDLGLLRIYYGTMAARPCYTRCGARIRPLVLVERISAYSTIGAIAVTTRCRGWRRHRHRATVTGRPGEVRLGELWPG